MKILPWLTVLLNFKISFLGDALRRAIARSDDVAVQQKDSSISHRREYELGNFGHESVEDSMMIMNLIISKSRNYIMLWLEEVRLAPWSNQSPLTTLTTLVFRLVSWHLDNGNVVYCSCTTSNLVKGNDTIVQMIQREEMIITAFYVSLPETLWKSICYHVQMKFMVPGHQPLQFKKAMRFRGPEWSNTRYKRKEFLHIFSSHTFSSLFDPCKQI